MQNLNSLIKKYCEEKPLILILWIAIMLRLIAVIFAKGWGMLDDHFLVIEIAQSWVDDGNFNHWLPWSPENSGPTGHTFFYAGLHFLLFSFFKWIHLDDPQMKMFFVRLIHAAFSMIIVILGYRITEKLSDKKSAKMVGLLLAAFWFMPWASVRNLVEVVSIPFLFISTWMILKADDRKKVTMIFLWAGFVAGIAFSIRYQTLFYAGGMGLALLFTKRLREALIFGAGYFISVIIFQGLIDFIIWGQPFAEFTEYIRYNMEYRNSYLTGEWYKYLLVLFGVLIPPVSIFLLVGMFKNWKKPLIIFLPTFIFLAFHSYFPNKQERFILTIVPFIILLGVMGWNKIYYSSNFLQRHKRWIKACWIFFWFVNIIVLSTISTMYSKRAPVEAMNYLSKYDEVKAIVVDNSDHTNIQLLPQFYLNEWIKIYEVTNIHPIELLHRSIAYTGSEPRFALFIQEENIEKRVGEVKTIMPELEFETIIEPGFVDKIMHWLNPHNKNEVIYIYRNNKFFPEQE